MLKKNINKIIVLLSSSLVIFILLFFPLEDQGKKLLNNSLEEAMIVFGVAKGLNAAISVAQGTQVGPPGLTLSIGEVLDPINDLVEQFSWIMLASITSLGLQKILLDIMSTQTLDSIIIGVILIYNLWLFNRFRQDSNLRKLYFKFTVILIFLRLGIPLMMISNNYIYENIVKNNYNISIQTQNIQVSSTTINNITHATLEDKGEKSSFFNSVKNIFSFEYYAKKIDQYKKATQNSSDNILNLIIAFVFTTLFFPLVFLYFLFQLLRGLFKEI